MVRQARTGQPGPAGAQWLATKCDLCREISGGPACVRSCPTGAAIRLTPEEYKSTLEEIVITRGER